MRMARKNACAIVRGRIKGASVPIQYATSQCQYETTGTVGSIYCHTGTCDLICTELRVFRSGHTHRQSQRTQEEQHSTTLRCSHRRASECLCYCHTYTTAQISYSMAAGAHSKYWHCVTSKHTGRNTCMYLSLARTLYIYTYMYLKQYRVLTDAHCVSLHRRTFHVGYCLATSIIHYPPKTKYIVYMDVQCTLSLPKSLRCSSTVSLSKSTLCWGQMPRLFLIWSMLLLMS